MAAKGQGGYVIAMTALFKKKKSGTLKRWPDHWAGFMAFQMLASLASFF